jgi:hypothetical protein
MEQQVRITVIHRDGDVYVARCPELDMEREGDSAEQADASLRQAIASLLETADPEDMLEPPAGDWQS